MKALYVTFFLVFSFFSLKAQHNDLLWVSQLTGAGQSVPTSVVEDASGNLYVVGNYTTTISQGAFSLTVVGNQDIYIAKYNSQGQILWLKGIGGSLAENAAGIALSPDGNSFYIGGQFTSNDCNFGGTTLATAGVNDVFLAKYNASDGTLLWAIKSAYGATQQFGGNITVDASGNVVQLMKYVTNVTFYGGTTTLTSTYSGIQENAVAKFDQNGNLIWAKTFKGNNSNSYIRTVTSDNTSYYFSGQYADSLYLEVKNIYSMASTRDMFLFRTDLDGNVQWVRTITGGGDEYLIRHFTDYSSYQYVAGYYASPTLIIDSTATLTSSKTCPNKGSNDIFLACYAFDGTLQWATGYGSTGDDQATGVYANADHAIFTGSYTGNISFGSFNLTNSATDAFMLETDRNGNVLGVNKASGTGNDYCETGEINASNANVFVGPFYSGTLNIGNKTLTNPAPATRDMFLAKFGKINLSFVTVNNLCYGDSSGSIDLTVSGDGTSPYTFAWTGPNSFTSTQEDINLLKAGWYKVTVTDALGAQKIDSSYISEGTAIALIFNVQNTSCFGVNDGSINLTVTGGASPYTYHWSTGSTQEDINGLAPAWYYVTVTDANGCNKSDSIKVNTPAPLTVSGMVTPPSCVPGHDGAIDITPTGGTPGYSYLWSNTATTEDVSALIFGIYGVTVTDANNCTVSQSFNVVNPLAPTISAIIEAPSCTPGHDGQIDIIISGGTIPFSYNWNDGDTLEDRTNLTAGTYSITVTDAHSCSSIKTNMVVPANNPPSLSYLTQKPTCNPGNDGSIDLIVYNGTSPFSYNWSNGASTEDISSLAPGTYNVTVTDNKNCTATKTINLTIDSPVVSLLYHGSSTFCEGDSLAIWATNGSGFTYEWYNNGSLIAGYNTPVYMASATGDYYVVVTNASGCQGYSDTASLTVNPKPVVTITPSFSDVCMGNPVTLTANGGQSYIWSTGSNSNPITIQPSVTTTYSVTATDNNGCTNSANQLITVNALPSITDVVTDETCSAGTGSIDITITEGQTPYSFIWSNSAITEDISNVNAGIYSVTVTDAHNCSSIKTNMVVQASNPPSLSYLTQKPTCNPGNDGSIDLIVYNGTAPFSYNWSNGASTEDISSLAPGTYNVTVTDNKNCTATQTIALTIDSPIVNITYHGNTTFCEGDSLTLYATNGSNFTFEWYNSGSSITGTNVPVYAVTSSGNYYVVVINASGCKGYSDTVSVVVNPKPIVTINASSNFICEGIPVLLTANGGQSYIWNDGSVANPITVQPLTTTTYSVTATNVNGCTNTANQLITVNANPSISGIVTPETCAHGTGSIDITVTNGQTPYSFSWSNSAITEDISNLTSGSYSVTVTTATTNCTSTYTAQVDSFVALSASLNTHTLVLFCANIANGEAHITATNGSQPYHYHWSNGDTTSYNNQLGVGTTYVTVTDQCNSVIVDSIIATNLSPMQATITSSLPASCSSSTNGFAEVTVTGGVMPYTYSWSNSTSIADSANNLPVGWQYVTVSDYCGSIIDSVQITNLPPMQATISFSAPVSCSGLSNGMAVITIVDGVAPFTYLWSSGETTQTATQLPAGLNSVTVNDACGWVILSVNIGVQSPMSIDITSSSSASCPAITNGSATVTVSNGSAPFTYLWTSGETTATATHLAAGMNYVTVTDTCLTLIDSVLIDVIPPVTANITFTENASCMNSQDGKATVTVQNGYAPFTYVWSNSTSTDSVAVDLHPGWNYVTVTDQCASSIDSVEIGYKTPLQAFITSNQPTDCSSDSTGMAIVTPTYGVQPYSYTWNYGTSTDSVLQHLPTGNYFVTVTDFCGSVVVPFSINFKTPLTVSHQKTNVLCFGNSNGSISLIPQNGVLPYSYSWSNSTVTDSILANLSAGIYRYTVTDKCGSFSDSIIIKQPGQLSSSNSVTPVSFEGLSDGKIDLWVFGGTQPYSYIWSNGALTVNLTSIPEGSYRVTVTDDNGCFINDSMIVVSEGKHIEIYNAFTPNGDGKNDVWNIKHIQAFPDCKVLVYDQWGVKVFESAGYSKPWDGTKNNKQLPSATYYYVIDLNDGSQPLTGSVTIMK